MKAIALTVGTGDLELVDRPEPSITAPDQVKVQVLRVGICGTDREEANGGRALAPNGSKQLVIGHEMVGQVVAVGKAVTRAQVGDYAVFTVRRGCGKCLPCAMNRPDMCLTGEYRERGIWGLDGYECEFVVDSESNMTRVPPELGDLGVLCEPTSVVEKAIAETVRIQMSRLPDALATPDWLSGRHCLVAGLGPIGLLASMVLRLRGANIYGMDIVDEQNPRAQWIKTIGGQYIDGRRLTPEKVKSKFGPMDLILDAAGVAVLDLTLLDALALDGVIVLTGIPGADKKIQIDGPALIRQMVLNNQLMFGSVNAARGHFEMGVDDLLKAHNRFPGLLGKLITSKHPYTDFKLALTRESLGEIKQVIDWTSR